MSGDHIVAVVLFGFAAICAAGVVVAAGRVTGSHDPAGGPHHTLTYGRVVVRNEGNDQ